MKTHHYAARLIWDGNLGQGTSAYDGYSRRYHTIIAGKPDLPGTADPMFRGEADRHNPEDLFLAALSACHMLTYLALCARKGLRVVAYEDDATGTMSVDAAGGGRFDEVTLRPKVTIAGADRVALAEELHETAHQQCFIANSCSVPIRLQPVIRPLLSEEA